MKICVKTQERGTPPIAREKRDVMVDGHVAMSACMHAYPCTSGGSVAFNAMLFSSGGVSVLSDRHPGHTPGPAMSSWGPILAWAPKYVVEGS